MQRRQELFTVFIEKAETSTWQSETWIRQEHGVGGVVAWPWVNKGKLGIYRIN